MRHNHLKMRSAFTSLLLMILFCLGTNAFAAMQTQHQDAYTIKIQRGDTLTKIAEKHCSTVEVLVKRNKIRNPDLIAQGANLVIPSTHCAQAKQANRADYVVLGKSDKTKRTARVAYKRSYPVAGCEQVSGKVSGFEGHVIARASCIYRTYGQYIEEGQRQAKKEYGYTPSVSQIIAVMYHESKGNPLAISKARVPCLGLMQLQPATARDYGLRVNMFDPRTNIIAGIKVLASYTTQYGKGDLNTGKAMYNAGPGYPKWYSKKERKWLPYDFSRFGYVRTVNQIQVVIERNYHTIAMQG